MYINYDGMGFCPVHQGIDTSLIALAEAFQADKIMRFPYAGRAKEIFAHHYMRCCRCEFELIMNDPNPLILAISTTGKNDAEV